MAPRAYSPRVTESLVLMKSRAWLSKGLAIEMASSAVLLTSVEVSETGRPASEMADCGHEDSRL